MAEAVVQGLTGVVGGSKNGNGVVLGKARHNGTSNIHSASTSPSPGIGGRKTVTASGKREKKVERVALHKGKEVKPEQVIPLEEGSFKEF